MGCCNCSQQPHKNARLVLYAMNLQGLCIPSFNDIAAGLKKTSCKFRSHAFIEFSRLNACDAMERSFVAQKSTSIPNASDFLIVPVIGAGWSSSHHISPNAVRPKQMVDVFAWKPFINLSRQRKNNAAPVVQGHFNTQAPLTTDNLSILVPLRVPFMDIELRI